MQLQKKACEYLTLARFGVWRTNFSLWATILIASSMDIFCSKTMCKRILAMTFVDKIDAWGSEEKNMVLAPSKKLSINGTHKRDAQMRMRSSKHFLMKFPRILSSNIPSCWVPKMGNSCCPAEDGHVRRLKYIYIYIHMIYVHYIIYNVYIYIYRYLSLYMLTCITLYIYGSFIFQKLDWLCVDYVDHNSLAVFMSLLCKVSRLDKGQKCKRLFDIIGSVE